jgi:hypothetical protein
MTLARRETIRHAPMLPDCFFKILVGIKPMRA